MAGIEPDLLCPRGLIQGSHTIGVDSCHHLVANSDLDIDLDLDSGRDLPGLCTFP